VHHAESPPLGTARRRALRASVSLEKAQDQVPQELRRLGAGHPRFGQEDGRARRHVRNRRLADALHQQAFCALSASPGARAYYDSLRARGTGHHAALRQLSNRLVGILHGCLKTHTLYDETTAWAHHTQDQQAAA
jgi:hypothetical protein